MPAQDVFKMCVEAIRDGELIHRVSSADKEFHFQNWFKARLEHAGHNFEIGGRNSYPDFRMVATTDGYELKGLAIRDGMRASTAIARCRPDHTTVARFTTSSGDTPNSLMEMPIQFSTSSSATATS